MDAGVFYLFFPEGEGFMSGEGRCLGDGGGADGAALGDSDGVFELPELSGERSFSILFIRPNSPRIPEMQAHRPCPPAL